MKNINNRPIIGILYPGEMGASLGKLLIDNGFPVVTTLEGRSPRTCRLCEQIGLGPMKTLEDVVNASEIVFSLVPPGAAVELAERFNQAVSTLACPPIYVEANSISPGTLARIEPIIKSCGARLIDASIHGLAGRLRQQGTLFLSGPGAGELTELLSGVMRVENLGDKPGMASLFKMLLGGVSKGIVGLFVEMGLAAREADMLEPFLSTCRNYYPGLMEAIDRLLPTLPRHVRRRAVEMDELDRTVRSLDLPLEMAGEIRRLYSLLGDSGLPEQAKILDLGSSTIAEVMELIGSFVSPRHDVAATVPVSVVSV